MKTLSALALLLVGCTDADKLSITTYTPLEQAVINAMREEESDYVSSMNRMAEITNRAVEEQVDKYIPLRFGKPMPFTRSDSIKNAFPELAWQNRALKDELDRMLAESHEHDEELVSGTTITQGALRLSIIRQTDSMLTANRQQLDQSNKLASKQIIGQKLLHVCRFQAKMDSGYFVVYKKGQVKLPRHFIRSHWF